MSPIISGICIAASLRIPRELNNDTFYHILQDLTKQTHAKARAVVMFVNEDNIRRLLAAAIKHKVRILPSKEFFFFRSNQRAEY